MSEILCITNRALCGGGYLAQLEAIAAAHPRAIVLREKDLSEGAYEDLAKQVLVLCARQGTPCILHSFPAVARRLGCGSIHLPLGRLRELGAEEKEAFSCIGASTHSVEEAREAQNLGATYITAGHVFVTDCKKDLAPRGLAFLRAVCESVTIPVYAIGGVSEKNIAAVRQCGAAGACVMSGLMQSAEAAKTLERLQRAWDEGALENGG